MLTRRSNKEVLGPDFAVCVPSVHRIEYREGDHVAGIEIEGTLRDRQNVTWLVYAQTLTGWDVPHAEEPMSRNQRDLILKRVSASLELLQMPHQVV